MQPGAGAAASEWGPDPPLLLLGKPLPQLIAEAEEHSKQRLSSQLSLPTPQLDPPHTRGQAHRLSPSRSYSHPGPLSPLIPGHAANMSSPSSSHHHPRYSQRERHLTAITGAARPATATKQEHATVKQQQQQQQHLLSQPLLQPWYSHGHELQPQWYGQHGVQRQRQGMVTLPSPALLMGYHPGPGPPYSPATAAIAYPAAADPRSAQACLAALLESTSTHPGGGYRPPPASPPPSPPMGQHDDQHHGWYPSAHLPLTPPSHTTHNLLQPWQQSYLQQQLQPWQQQHSMLQPGTQPRLQQQEEEGEGGLLVGGLGGNSGGSPGGSSRERRGGGHAHPNQLVTTGAATATAATAYDVAGSVQGLVASPPPWGGHLVTPGMGSGPAWGNPDEVGSGPAWGSPDEVGSAPALDPDPDPDPPAWPTHCSAILLPHGNLMLPLPRQSTQQQQQQQQLRLRERGRSAPLNATPGAAAAAVAPADALLPSQHPTRTGGGGWGGGGALMVAVRRCKTWGLK